MKQKSQFLLPLKHKKLINPLEYFTIKLPLTFFSN